MFRTGLCQWFRSDVLFSFLLACVPGLVLVAPPGSADEDSISSRDCVDAKIPYSPGRLVYLPTENDAEDALPAGARAFRERHGPSWRISIDEQLGTPRFLEPREDYPLLEEVDLSSAASRERLIARLRAFVDENAALFGVSAEDLGEAQTVRIGTGCVVSFLQVVDDGSQPEPVTIRGAVLRFHVDEQARLLYAKGYLLRDAAARGAEWADRELLEQRVFEEGRELLHATREYAFLDGEPGVLDPIWSTTVIGEDGVNARELRDAATAELLVSCRSVEHLEGRVEAHAVASDFRDPFAHREDIQVALQPLPPLFFLSSEALRPRPRYHEDDSLTWEIAPDTEQLTIVSFLAIDTRAQLCDATVPIPECHPRRNRPHLPDLVDLGCARPEFYLDVSAAPPPTTPHFLFRPIFELGQGCREVWAQHADLDVPPDAPSLEHGHVFNWTQTQDSELLETEASGWLHDFEAAARMLFHARAIINEDLSEARDADGEPLFGAFETLSLAPVHSKFAEVVGAESAPKLLAQGRQYRIEYTPIFDVGDTTVRVNSTMIAHEIGHYLMTQMTGVQGEELPIEEGIADVIAAVFLREPRVAFIKNEDDNIVKGPFGRDLSARPTNATLPSPEDDARTHQEKMRPYVSSAIYEAFRRMENDRYRQIFERLLLSWLAGAHSDPQHAPRLIDDASTILHELLRTLDLLGLDPEDRGAIAERLRAAFPSAIFRSDIPFIRGDGDLNRLLEITDAVIILAFLFQGTNRVECADAMDLDDDGKVELNDAVYLLNHLFRGGPELASPNRICGYDPTADALDCDDFTCPE